MDILGPFPKAKGQVRHVVVIIDYFTKWVEAETLAKITSGAITSFLWKNLFCRFGVPHAIITDHGTQFDSVRVREMCANMGVSLKFSSVHHPPSNGQVENMNRTIVKDIQTRLDGALGRWAELLPLVLWTYRTTSRRATGDTPFALVYGADAVVPVETLVPSARVLDFNKEDNDEALRTELYVREERRDIAALKSWEFKRRTAEYYNKRVKGRRL